MLLPIPIDAQIRCVERELAMRRRVYPGLVHTGRLTQAKMDNEPAWVDKVCAGFQLLKAHGEVPANLALTASDRVQQAAVQTTGEVLPRGGDKKSEETKSIGKLPIDEQSHRAQQNGIGERTQRKLDRLARDYPELHAQVTTGELSAHGAAKAAGFIKDTPPLTQLRRSWHKATSDERAIFLAEIREEF